MSLYDAEFQVEDKSGKSPRFSGNIPTIHGNWKGYYTNVARAIRGQEELEVTAQHALNVIKLFELARESAATGKAQEWV